MTGRQILTVIPGLLMTVMAWAGAPDIPLKDLDGNAHNVNEYIGHTKWTVVLIWAHDCHICDREIHEASSFHNARFKKNAMVLGISLDGADQVQEAREFVKRHNLPFVNLITEPYQEVLEKFGAGNFVGTPTYYIYNPEGDIVGQNIGPLTRTEMEEFILSFEKAPRDDQ